MESILIDKGRMKGLVVVVHHGERLRSWAQKTYRLSIQSTSQAKLFINVRHAPPLVTATDRHDMTLDWEEERATDDQPPWGSYCSFWRWYCWVSMPGGRTPTPLSTTFTVVSVVAPFTSLITTTTTTTTMGTTITILSWTRPISRTSSPGKESRT